MKQFAALVQISDDVEPLLVFEIFVHLQDVRVVQVLQVADLVHNHRTIVFLQVRLFQDLDCSLRAGLPLDTQADLIELVLRYVLANDVILLELSVVQAHKVASSESNIRPLLTFLVRLRNASLLQVVF